MLVQIIYIYIYISVYVYVYVYACVCVCVCVYNKKTTINKIAFNTGINILRIQ